MGPFTSMSPHLPGLGGAWGWSAAALSMPVRRLTSAVGLAASPYLASSSTQNTSFATVPTASVIVTLNIGQLAVQPSSITRY